MLVYLLEEEYSPLDVVEPVDDSSSKVSFGILLSVRFVVFVVWLPALAC